MPTARVREACGIPGTSVETAFLCRDKPAMKETLRQAGIPCAQSAAATAAGRTLRRLYPRPHRHRATSRPGTAALRRPRGSRADPRADRHGAPLRHGRWSQPSRQRRRAAERPRTTGASCSARAARAGSASSPRSTRHRHARNPRVPESALARATGGSAHGDRVLRRRLRPRAVGGAIRRPAGGAVKCARLPPRRGLFPPVLRRPGCCGPAER